MSKYEPLWEDRDIRFDLNKEQLCLREGEHLVQNHASVEDTKGNPGKKGELFITNLRVIWKCIESPKVNLSIGLSGIHGIFTKKSQSKLLESSESIFLSTKHKHNRFEFIFTDEKKNSSIIFSTINAITKAYESSRLYRDLKLRGAFIHSGHLRLLPKEEITNKISGVWNLSSEQGNLGLLYITNIRIVWFAEVNESYNVSIPYLQINSIKVRDSKFGFALVIESTWQSGGYVLGFRIDPIERIRKVGKEIQVQYQMFMSSPNFGIQFSVEAYSEKIDEKPSIIKSRDAVNEDLTIDTSLKSDVFMAYFADGQVTEDEQISKPIFCPELGLAIEPLKSGATIESLWKLF